MKIAVALILVMTIYLAVLGITVMGSASHLEVDGGTLQVFTNTGPIELSDILADVDIHLGSLQ